MCNMTCEDESFSPLLELAANDELEPFKAAIAADPTAADRTGLWYERNKVSNRMVLEHRTPLMVAATFGSTKVLSFLLSLPSVDVNSRSGSDRTTALHCAAAGGSHTAVDSVRLLLMAGADSDASDAKGRRPADVISVPGLYPDTRLTLEDLLGCAGHSMNHRGVDLRVSICNSSSTEPPLSLSSPDEDGSPSSDLSSSSPMADRQKKEYPVDPTLPDIKSSIYASDEFRMFSFKVRPCSRAYSHDWTECPFVHPGENARRRDPRKFHYSCVPCPDFRRGGACRRGDMCEYAHGVFESWLHPAQYRTRLCKDGTACDRRVCFFAHTAEELRPLYVSTGSAVPSPRSAMAMEMAAAALGLMPGSPSSPSSHGAHFTPPGSPSWSGQQGNNSSLQASRLRSSLSARDMPVDELSLLFDLEASQKFNDLCLSSNNSHVGISSPMGSRPIRPKPLGQANLDDLLSTEALLSPLSPRFNNTSEQGATASVAAAHTLFSPTHKSAVLNHRLLSPINTRSLYSSKESVNLQPPTGLSPTSGRMVSPRSIDALASPLSSRLAALAHRDKINSSSVAPVIGSPVSNSQWAKMGSPLGKVDWSVNGGGLNNEEPDVSWVHSLVSPPDVKERQERDAASNGADSARPIDGMEQIGAWLEQMQLDQIK
ncbi:Zinc finger CCCH domain-containing protein [Rhynchospora pubera]|uniref:Zinc finger CCCH domain-containing protein n=1 Tax=Rhynchospora pubera TaxID=906938 RepID=A0AAV8DLY3_9POAL|nr:Zinc finger CCCH domain-containing protein [Rhynchospora pubera]